MFQGGYSNFAAKRAARHGKTKQYKESLKNQKVNDNKQPETKNDTKKSGGSSKPRHMPHPKQMVYPAARGPNELTGDTLLIKCLEYLPPKTTSSYEYTLQYANKKGVTENGIKYNEGDLKRIDKGKNAGKLSTKIAPSTFKMVNQGASDRLSGATLNGSEKSIFYVELPIPQDVNDSNTITWGDDSLNILQLAGLAAAQKIVEDPGQAFDEVKNLLTEGITGGLSIGDDTKAAITAAISGKAIDPTGQNVSMNSAIGRATGMTLNSNLELLFDSVNLRTFPFTINFSPRTRAEAMTVKHIIRAFKSAMAAKKGTSDAGQGGAFLRAPDVFQLRYLHRGKDHPFLNSFKHCALTGMQVNYTGAGTFASYSDGTPVNIKMSLTFKELNPIYFEDYEGFTPNDGMGVGF